MGPGFTESCERTQRIRDIRFDHKHIKGFVTRPLSHIAVSGIIGISVGICFNSIACAITSFITGVFVDVDHLIDYSLNYNFTANLKFIYNACARIELNKIYILLHSYEVMVVFWVLIYALSLPAIWKAAAIGLTQHLILDQLSNPVNAYGYFLTYRIACGFDTKKIINAEKMAALKQGGLYAKDTDN